MVDSSVPLFQTCKIGDLELRNRIVMSALTRQRANVKDGCPTEEFVKYYAARADAGLILSECIPISMEANGY